MSTLWMTEESKAFRNGCLFINQCFVHMLSACLSHRRMAANEFQTQPGPRRKGVGHAEGVGELCPTPENRDPSKWGRDFLMERKSGRGRFHFGSRDVYDIRRTERKRKRQHCREKQREMRFGA